MSQLSMMNDYGEGSFVLDKFYTNSNFKEMLKRDWDESFYPEHIPFIFSTIETDIKSRNRGNLPMWEIYGDDCQGVLIRFNFKKLKNYCESKGIIFSKCQYHTNKEVNLIISNFNKSKVSNAEFNNLMKTSCITKNKDWEHENEWRIIVYANKNKVKLKLTERGLVQYTELELPIDLIEEICLGPRSDKNFSLESINILKNKLQLIWSEKVHFKISTSSIKIR